MGKKLRETAFAKINLTLDISGQREDGYHLLSTLMHTVSLRDDVELYEADRFELLCDSPTLPTDDRNLCRKAAKVFFERYDIGEPSLGLSLTKRIPSGAGLGGGSSDAAAVLRLLRRWYGIPGSLNELAPLASEIGADVPFFLRGGFQLAEGIGERLTPIVQPLALSVVLLKGELSASTPGIYRAYDLQHPISHRGTVRFLSALRDGGDLFAAVSNDLASVTASFCPQIDLWKKRLRECGALAAEMTGSGSAVFGLFSDQNTAASAMEQISAPFRALCDTVSGYGE